MINLKTVFDSATGVEGRRPGRIPAQSEELGAIGKHRGLKARCKFEPMRRAVGPDAHFCRHPARCATAIKLSEDRRQKVGHPERSQRGTSCEVKDPVPVPLDGVTRGKT